MTTLVYCQSLAQELSPWDVCRASTWEGVRRKLRIVERGRKGLQTAKARWPVLPVTSTSSGWIITSAVTTGRELDRLQFCCRQELGSPTQQSRLSRWWVYLAEASKEPRHWSEAKSCIVAQSGMWRSTRTACLILLQLQLLQSPHSFSVANVEVTKSRGQLLPLWGPISSWVEVRGCEMGLSALLIGTGSPLERPDFNTHGCYSGLYLKF